MSEQLVYLRRAQDAIRDRQAEIVLYVAQARTLGDSWTAIGHALGMSKQAARQRFGTVRERQHPEGQTSIDDVHED